MWGTFEKNGPATKVIAEPKEVAKKNSCQRYFYCYSEPIFSRACPI